MPARERIQREIDSYRRQGSAGQDRVRRKYLKAMSNRTGRATILYASGYSIPRTVPVPPAALSITSDDIQGFMAAMHGLREKELDLILHSPGGSSDAADQIVQYLRSKFDHIRAIVPQSAMSAATMLACACDEIVMGRHSALGPIDPQLGVQGAFVPAHAILQDFEKAKRDVGENPHLAGLWAARFGALPAGMLNICEQSIALAKQKVEQWLDLYMFKKKDKKKAADIADWLGDFDQHKTHGRPIGFDLAQGKGLKVSRLEDAPELQEDVLSIFHSTMVTLQETSCVKIVENHQGKGFLVVLATPSKGP